MSRDDLHYAALLPVPFRAGVTEAFARRPYDVSWSDEPGPQFAYEVGRAFGCEVAAVVPRGAWRLAAWRLSCAVRCLAALPPGVRVVAVDVARVVEPGEGR